MVEPGLSPRVVRRRRGPAMVLVATLLWSAALGVGLTAGLGLVHAETWSDPGPVEEPWSYPPRIVGRAEAEVLDVDRGDGAVLLDVAFTSAGRTRTVTWVDATHLPEVPDVGGAVPVAYVPYDPEIAFELDDPGLSDPFDNGFLRFDTPPPPEPPAPRPWGLGLLGAGVLLALAAVTTVTAVVRRPPTASGVTVPAG